VVGQKEIDKMKLTDTQVIKQEHNLQTVSDLYFDKAMEIIDSFPSKYYPSGERDFLPYKDHEMTEEEFTILQLSDSLQESEYYLGILFDKYTKKEINM